MSNKDKNYFPYNPPAKDTEPNCVVCGKAIAEKKDRLFIGLRNGPLCSGCKPKVEKEISNIENYKTERAAILAAREKESTT